MFVSKIRHTNATDVLASFFAGDMSFESAVTSAAEIFMSAYESGTFICSVCGKIIFPKLTTNEHGIFICDSRTEIRGGLANKLIKKDICEECAKDMIKMSAVAETLVK